MKKFLLLSALLYSIFLPISYAQEADTCDSVYGSWTGSWTAFEYHCSAYGEGFRNGENVFFNFKVFNCPRLAQNFSMSGKCHEGKITLANPNATMSGIITTNTLFIKGSNQAASFYKH